MNRDGIAARLGQLIECGGCACTAGEICPAHRLAVEIADGVLERADALSLALEHATSSLEHLMTFKGSRLEEMQRAGHELNITRGREAVAAYRGPRCHTEGTP